MLYMLHINRSYFSGFHEINDNLCVCMNKLWLQAFYREAITPQCNRTISWFHLVLEGWASSVDIQNINSGNI